MNKKIRIVITLGLMVSIIQGPLFANIQRVLSSQNGKVDDTVMEHNGCKRYKLNYVINSNGMKPSENQKTMMSKDIVEIVAGDDRFETLAAALNAAGLVDTLKGEGPFTVFAPTDDAFAKLSPGTIDELLKPENKDTLVNILTYHVIADKVLAEDAIKLDGKEVDMVNGDKARIEVRDGSVYIDGAKVILTDIMAKNGVIHVIDTVIMPPTD